VRWEAMTPVYGPGQRPSRRRDPDLPVRRGLTGSQLGGWAHDKGVPAKVVAQVMGHTKVDTTMDVYTQVLDGAARLAADRVGSELFRVPGHLVPPGERWPHQLLQP